MKRHVIAADVGGTNIRVAIVDEAGRIHARHRQQAELSQLKTISPVDAAEKVLQVLESCFLPLLEKDSDIDAIGIGFPGFFRAGSGVLASSPNVPGLVDFPLAEGVSKAIGLPVCADNDAMAACLGEFCFGAGKGLSHLLHITLGTGVGGGAVIDHSPYAGEGGMSMEIGHLRVVDPLSPDARLCGCGGRGCLETYSSATAVSSRFIKESGRERITPVEIHELANNGDALARQLLEEAGSYLGQAIAEIVKVIDIRTVTVGGGLSYAWDWLHRPLLRRLEERVLPPQRGQIRVLHSSLGDDAGILGAASLALEAK